MPVARKSRRLTADEALTMHAVMSDPHFAGLLYVRTPCDWPGCDRTADVVLHVRGYRAMHYCLRCADYLTGTD